MSVKATIEAKLKAALEDAAVEVIDESHLHRGHVGARPGGESHFRLRLVSTTFEGVSPVQRQRLVTKILAEELAGPVHALSMQTITPGESAKQSERTQ